MIRNRSEVLAIFRKAEDMKKHVFKTILDRVVRTKEFTSDEVKLVRQLLPEIKENMVNEPNDSTLGSPWRLEYVCDVMGIDFGKIPYALLSKILPEEDIIDDLMKGGYGLQPRPWIGDDTISAILGPRGLSKEDGDKAFQFLSNEMGWPTN